MRKNRDSLIRLSKPNKLVLLSITIMVWIFCPSCKKYLEKKSDTSVAVPTTLNDFQALLDRSLAMNQITPSSGDASSDDFFIQASTYGNLTTYAQDFYSWIPYDYTYDNDWSNGYLCVYPCNLCLQDLTAIPVTPANRDQWNNIKGSALFYRSYAFLNMVWIYGKAFDDGTASSDLGIALRMGTDFNEPTTRASVKQSYDQITNDLKEALNYLPALPVVKSRPSKAAAYGLLARVYLSMRKYEDASKYADSCLQLQSYLMDYNGDPGVFNLAGNSPFNTYSSNGEMIFYSLENRLNTLHIIGTGTIDTLLYQSYAADDLRKKGFFRSLGNNFWAFKGSYISGVGNSFTGLATDEMYLIRAECSARAGSKDSAIADLNTVIKKRWSNNGTWQPFTAADAQDALNKILVERRKELLYRGLRWSDIKRLNKEGRNIILKRILPNGTISILQPNANYYALPLPKDIVDLTGIPQNPR